VILIPALLARWPGGSSLIVHPKYTSQALVMVEGQKVPESMVQPVVTEDLTRVATLQQQVLSQSRLEPIGGETGLGQERPAMADVIEDIR